MDAKGNPIDVIRDMCDKSMLASSIASLYVYTCEAHLAVGKLYTAGAYLGAAQDALRRSPSDRGRWYVDGTRRLLEEAISDYADAVGYRVPPIECFMESR